MIASGKRSKETGDRRGEDEPQRNLDHPLDQVRPAGRNIPFRTETIGTGIWGIIIGGFRSVKKSGSGGSAFLRQNGAAQGNCGFAQQTETVRPARLHGLSEAATGHVQLRFDEEKPTARSEKGGYLSEEPGLVPHLVDHPEGENEIGDFLYPQTIRPAAVRNDPVGQPCLARPASEGRKHLFLEVDRNDLPIRTDQFRQTQREISHPGQSNELDFLLKS
jgi:hypothetical protein